MSYYERSLTIVVAKKRSDATFLGTTSFDPPDAIGCMMADKL